MFLNVTCTYVGPFSEGALFRGLGEVFACSDMVFQVVVSLHSSDAEFSVFEELL